MIKKASKYARFFDASSRDWQVNNELNMFYLKTQQNYANDLLKSRGHLFLNEVYDFLGMPRTKEGTIVGWLRGKFDGDGFVDFMIPDPSKQDFKSGILLDFNVDGVIAFDFVDQWDHTAKPPKINREILVEESEGSDQLLVWCDKKHDAKIRAIPGVYLTNDCREHSGVLTVYVDHRYDRNDVANYIESL